MIRIICVGKIKEAFYRDAISEYLKRLQKYHKVIIEEVVDSDINNEGKLIMDKIRDKDYVITLEIDGIEMDSIAFSSFLDGLFVRKSNIVFVIGGSNGLSAVVKNRADDRISFSKLTFPHQLFRVILLEQIYRCFKIINNETYHK